MATPEPLEPSQRLRAAAAAERARLARELARLDERVDLLGQELEQIEARRDAIRRRLSLLARLAHGSTDATATAERGPVAATARVRSLRAAPDESSDRPLQGAAIREAAVRALIAAGVTTRPLHYREWFDLLSRQGFAVAGKRPEATFLTQLGRSPVVRRAGSAGVYTIHVDAPNELRTRIRELRAELARPEERGLTPPELADDRACRVRLTRQLAKAERNLEEALRVLGEAQA